MYKLVSKHEDLPPELQGEFEQEYFDNGQLLINGTEVIMGDAWIGPKDANFGRDLGPLVSEIFKLEKAKDKLQDEFAELMADYHEMQRSYAELMLAQSRELSAVKASLAQANDKIMSDAIYYAERNERTRVRSEITGPMTTSSLGGIL